MQPGELLNAPAVRRAIHDARVAAGLSDDRVAKIELASMSLLVQVTDRDGLVHTLVIPVALRTS